MRKAYFDKNSPGDFFVEEVQPPVNAPRSDDLQMTASKVYVYKTYNKMIDQ